MFTYLGIAVPEFFWGIVVILVFAGYLDWLPSGGAGDLAAGLAAWASASRAAGGDADVRADRPRLAPDALQHAGGAAQPLRAVARAKGLPERVVVLRHALRNALLPTITVLASTSAC